MAMDAWARTPSTARIRNSWSQAHAAIEKRISRAKKYLQGQGSYSTYLLILSSPRVFRLFSVRSTCFSAKATMALPTRPQCARIFVMRRCVLTQYCSNILLEQRLQRNALAALMHLHAARLPARMDASENLSSMFDQDRSLWDSNLVAEGQRFLDLSATVNGFDRIPRRGSNRMG
jgi:predicted RNA polymerase sigma factor